jgi:two-component system NtrC family sensor kinase
MIKDSLIGVINIADKSSGKRFVEDEMQFLDFLTSQIALNYRRIHLYEKYRTAVKKSKELKVRLGETDKEKYQLQRQVVVQEKLASIGKLAGGIAHEFNNPLDGVMRYTNLCLEHLKEDEVVRNYLLEIKHGLNRMATIVKNLLACSRNEFPQRQIVDIKSALEHSISLKRMELTHKNISVIKNFEEGIPNIPDFGLERIFTNLFQNAIDAISYGGKITVDAKCQDNTLIISISDTGIGIPEDSVEKIFEPFYTTKDIGKGCGLGLTVVGEIVKSYNGKIDVSSKKNKGTTFNVTIPLE